MPKKTTISAHEPGLLERLRRQLFGDDKGDPVAEQAKQESDEFYARMTRQKPGAIAPPIGVVEMVRNLPLWVDPSPGDMLRARPRSKLSSSKARRTTSSVGCSSG
jgi:hypothetical protein